MSQTLKSAFDNFMINKVNLDPEKTKKARNSRDYLILNLKKFPDKIEDFPDIYEDKIIKFGSFARNTKLRPLDDIDLILTFSANGTTYLESSDSIELIVPENCDKLKKLCNGDRLNSRKLVNKIRDSLSTIPNYSSGETKRNQEATTLKLKTYDWNFDIVPGFFTKEDIYGNTYYIIPDGNGNWKKTDPRIDQNRVSEINKNNSGKVLELIRVIKKWNKRQNKPVLGSYLLENIVLSYCENETTILDPIKEIKYFFKKLIDNIFKEILDPKGLQGDLNTLSYCDKIKISKASKVVYEKLEEVEGFEKQAQHKKAIEKMKEVFGDDFLEY